MGKGSTTRTRTRKATKTKSGNRDAGDRRAEEITTIGNRTKNGVGLGERASGNTDGKYPNAPQIRGERIGEHARKEKIGPERNGEKR